MKQKYTEFDNYVISQIKKSFKFLETEYDCSVEQIQKDSWAMSVFYKNSTTVVRICLDQSGAGVYVELIRLVDNKIPERPIYRKGVHFFALGNILDLRAPSLKINKPTIDDLLFNPGWEKVVSSGIKQQAKALKMYAQDVLKGDFTVFNELNNKRRINKA